MRSKFFHSVYQPYKYIIYIPLVGLLTSILGMLAVLLAFTLGEKLASYCGVIWARLLSWAAPMKLVIEGKENIDKQQSYVIVSNHQSQFDILALYGWLGVDFKWVMKIELRKVPFLGLACEKLGHIYIDRSNTQAAVDSINKAKMKIKGGTSVLFFPEGSRSRDGKLRRFKKGAFKMALDLDIPVLPVTLSHTRDVLPSDTIDLYPGTARMVIHPPVGIEGFNDENLPELIDKVRKDIESKLEL